MRLILFLFALCPALFAASQPNFLLVMADDMGFSELGCYGSEIETPHLDKLAAGGLRFSQFYNTAKCHSSRVSLLSGRWSRQAGDESLQRAVILPEVLAPAGYFTAMTGKWHLRKQPTDFGFQRYFGHLSGATNYFTGDQTFRLNGQPFAVPETGFYTTIANVDHALKFIAEARAAKKPWFQYIAFNAPHAPLQPLEQDFKKYRGRYDIGWDAIRAARVAKQKQIGLLPADSAESPRPDHIPTWTKLSAEQRSDESRLMSAYAGLIDRIDQEMGRLIADLEKAGELDNTVILFVSDNGACPFHRGGATPNTEPYHATTRWGDSTGWAWARNSPFRFYKQNQFEGGISTPAILHWPAGLKQKPGSVVSSPAHLVDVLPTFAELAGAKVPTSYPDRQPSPLAGVSLAPIIAGGQMEARPPIHLLFSTDRGLRDGEWKLVSFQSGPWELYHMPTDRAELHDVAAQHPDIVQRMAKQWHDMTANVLTTQGKEAQFVATAATPKLNPGWSHYDDTVPTQTKSKANGKKKPAQAAATIPRARKDTQLTVSGPQLILHSTGTDPGLAFERLAITQPGPYTLEFRLQSKSSGPGELFWTTDPETILPKGKHLDFEVKHDGEWHEMKLRMDEAKTLHALRLDPCAGEGEVKIECLTLKAPDGKVLAKWP
ncbi:MAG: arylsulfatase [Verrucomicrobia bacterium]|nr:arylsulfatase [Verrucomicrobiota bacterium]